MCPQVLCGSVDGVMCPQVLCGSVDVMSYVLRYFVGVLMLCHVSSGTLWEC